MFLKKTPNVKASLAIRLAGGSAFISALVFAATFTLVYASLAASAHRRVDERLLHEAVELDAMTLRKDASEVQDAISDLAHAEGTGTFFYRVVDQDGTLVAQSDASTWEGLELNSVADFQEGGAARFDTRSIGPNGGNARTIYTPIGHGMVLQAAMRLEHELQPLRDLRRILLVIGSIGLVASCLMGWIAAKRVLRPLARMTATAQCIAEGQFEARVAVASDDAELDRLAQAFNAMLNRIQSFVREMRELNDGIAHDIRTVLARVHLAATRLLETRPLTEEQESLGVAVTENTAELVGMLDTVMDLSEINTGMTRVPSDSVDIAGLLHELVDLFELAAEEKSIDIALSCAPGIVVKGDANRLRRALANIIDNAVKYNEPNGRIEICAKRDSENVIVSVADTGIGISEDELPRIFNRFYRADKSRGGIGHGLGLSLAAAIIRLHGGEIAVASTEGKGSTFTMTLDRYAGGSPSSRPSIAHS